MAKRNIFRGLAAVLALGMCMTGLAGCRNSLQKRPGMHMPLPGT